MTDIHTITYRGYEIDPIHDPREDGNWPTCTVETATMFMIFPGDVDLPALEDECRTLDEAKAAIDRAITAQVTA